MKGVDKGAPQVQEAVLRLASSAKSGGAEGVSSGGSLGMGGLGAPTIHNHWGSMTPQQVAESQPALESITKAIVDAYKSAALPQRAAA